MATKSHAREPSRQSIQRCNRAVTERVNMSLRLYKSLKMAVLLAAAAAAVVAINNGGDPLTIYALLVLILAGPEAVETLIANGGDDG